MRHPPHYFAIEHSPRSWCSLGAIAFASRSLRDKWVSADTETRKICTLMEAKKYLLEADTGGVGLGCYLYDYNETVVNERKRIARADLARFRERIEGLPAKPTAL